MLVNSSSMSISSQQVEYTQTTRPVVQPIDDNKIIAAMNESLMYAITTATKILMDSVPDEKERSQKMERLSKAAVVMIENNTNFLFQQTNVKSASEYAAKISRLVTLINEASEKSVKSLEFINQSIQLDEEMVKASQHGIMDPAQLNTIHRFWRIVTQEGYGVVKAHNQSFWSFFMTSIENWMQELMSSIPVRFGNVDVRRVNLSMAEMVSKDLHVRFIAKKENLASRIHSSQSEREKILLSYLLLKADVEAVPVLNEIIRVHIRKFAENQEAIIKRETIFQQIIRLDPRYKESLTNRRTVEEDVNACCATVRSILALQPNETEYERVFTQLNLDEVGVKAVEVNTPLVLPEMHLDVTQLSVDYFFHRNLRFLQARITAFANLNRMNISL